MKLHCDMCGKAFEGNDKAPVPARFCSDCKQERHNLINRRSYRKTRYGDTQDIEYVKIRVLVKDPSPYPLGSGMQIPTEEHDRMLEFGTYTPGTVLKRMGDMYRIDKVGEKLVEVRI